MNKKKGVKIMKKIFVLFSFILTLFLNLNVVYAAQQTDEEFNNVLTKAKFDNFLVSLQRQNPTIDEDMAKILHSVVIFNNFNKTFNKYCGKNGIVDYQSFDVDETDIEHSIIFHQTFAKKEMNIKCFWKVDDKFVDKSDECILQRRNNKDPTSVCWFDYKRFLPKISKIKTDNDFYICMKLFIFTN